MLSVKTNRDISEYKNDMVGGFDLRETFFIGIGLVSGIGIMVLLMMFTNVPTVLVPYVAMPFIAVPVFKGFYNKDGMSLSQHRKKVKESQKSVPLLYHSTENAANYEKYLDIETKKELEEDSFDKTLKKVKILGIISGVIFVLLIVVAIILKLHLNR